MLKRELEKRLEIAERQLKALQAVPGVVDGYLVRVKHDLAPEVMEQLNEFCREHSHDYVENTEGEQKFIMDLRYTKYGEERVPNCDFAYVTVYYDDYNGVEFISAFPAVPAK
jgi:hypothetical protein